MIVLKFGGTSVGDPAALARAATIVAERVDHRPVVVASAMAGVTDQLLKFAGEAAGGGKATEGGELQRLAERHRAALAAVTPPGEARDRGEARLEHSLAGLEDALRAIRGGAALALPEVDLLLAHGELLSTTLLAAALESLGVDAPWVDARDLLATDDGFGKARPDMEITRCQVGKILRPLLEEGRVPVTQGFIGRARNGATTTIGRGGSDYSACIFGAVLEAEEVQIWTDVPGLMSADPRVVAGAHTLEEVSYDEAAELSYFGAKVLHPAAIIPLIGPGIPLRVRNSLDPAHPGTRVSAQSVGEPGRVKSVALKRGVGTVFIRSPRMLGAHGYLRRLFEVFDRHRIAVDVVATSEVSVSLSVEEGTVPEATLEELRTFGEVQFIPGRAIVCVVGEAMRDTPGIAARIFHAIRSVNVEMVSQGASRINVTLVVDDADAPEAVRLLHAEFFGE